MAGPREIPADMPVGGEGDFQDVPVPFPAGEGAVEARFQDPSSRAEGAHPSELLRVAAGGGHDRHLAPVGEGGRGLLGHSDAPAGGQMSEVPAEPRVGAGGGDEAELSG